MAPVEIGRVPTPPVTEPTVPVPAFPPANPVYWPDDFFGPPPPPYFPPNHIPPGPFPCDLDDDDDPETECDPSDDPEEPPVDVPEPGILILLITGALTWRLFQQRMRLS